MKSTKAQIETARETYRRVRALGHIGYVVRDTPAFVALIKEHTQKLRAMRKNGDNCAS
jgi:hypothetical protein